jgi:hypothetical protein
MLQTLVKHVRYINTYVLRHGELLYIEYKACE